MHIKAKLYPYPVLTDFNDDYIESNFDMEVSISKSPNKITIGVNTLLDNDGIKNLIREGYRKTYSILQLVGGFYLGYTNA